jgi:hypothetical protein
MSSKFQIDRSMTQFREVNRSVCEKNREKSLIFHLAFFQNSFQLFLSPEIFIIYSDQLYSSYLFTLISQRDDVSYFEHLFNDVGVWLKVDIVISDDRIDRDVDVLKFLETGNIVLLRNVNQVSSNQHHICFFLQDFIYDFFQISSIMD